MKISIPRRRFLKNSALTSSSFGFSWTNAVDLDSFIIGDCERGMSTKPIFELLCLEEPELVSLEIQKSFSILGANASCLPIDAVQSPQQMIENVKLAFKISKEALESLDAMGYLDTFMETNKTTKRLQRAQIDIDSLKRAIKSGEIKNVSIAKRFYPRRDGFLDLPEYSLTKTLTGRMTIVSGPQILTAPKFLRKYLKSSYPGGKIAQVDFVSLEPRVAMLLTEENLGDDVYDFLGKKLFSQKVSRTVVKKLVLCAVYGASEATLKKGLPEDLNVRQLINKTKQILNYDMVVKEQNKNYQKTEKIKNFFGRPITPQSERESLLYNNYIQSSAVDVALLGFGKILDQCSTRVRPLFFIHDAMLVDLHPDDIEEFKKVSSRIFIDRLGEFPLDFQVLG